MKLLYNLEGDIDLENPIFMEEDQLGEFVGFLKSLVNEEIKIIEVNEKERFINSDAERHPKKWVADDLILLLDSQLGEAELTKKLGRSSMSVGMQRAQFIPEFISWAKSKGFEANKITRTIIKQFLEEKDGAS